MDEIYAACLTYEPGLLDYVEFKKTSEPVWILGKKYITLNDDELQELQQDVRSKLWFTYRKQFPAIGNTCFTTDSGWGCMHRCGQMALAQTLIVRYLGREWLWEPECTNHVYLRIRNKFNDNEERKYSIHKTALQGDILDKRIGQWFGPNTVAQVLKKLAFEDMEEDLAIHVALDNMVIKSEIKKTCKEFIRNKQSNQHQQQEDENFTRNRNVCRQTPSAARDEDQNECGWCPLLLMIPLRLGLSEIIPTYFEKLKATLTFKQSVGIIGGRTNHASYFIGYVGNELVYLDPHTTQLYCPEMNDESYHCQYAGQMSIKQLDPSIALCFYCEDEEDFESWCVRAKNILLQPETDALFEILDEKLPMIPYSDDSDEQCGADHLESGDVKKYTSDDEFELL